MRFDRVQARDANNSRRTRDLAAAGRREGWPIPRYVDYDGAGTKNAVDEVKKYLASTHQAGCPRVGRPSAPAARRAVGNFVCRLRLRGNDERGR